MQLKELMSREVETASREMSIRDAASLMREGDFGVLPVVEEGRLVGIVTDRDIVVRCCAEGRGANDASVGDAMTEKTCSADQESTVEEAAALMQKHQIRRLPVVDSSNNLVGIVALGDFAVESTEIEAAAETLSGVSEGS